jgi:hypothetical protein
MYKAKLAVCIVSLFAFACVAVLFLLPKGDVKRPEAQPGEYASLFVDKGNGPYAGVSADLPANIFDTGDIPANLKDYIVKPKEQASLVYSFLQGPKSYSEGLAWAGSWCEEQVGYNKFGGFGCGFCCMANIYSTLTGYECSPLDIYEFAKTASKYYPTSESGAIGWKDMKRTLRAAGFTCKNYQKPATYKEFQEQMRHTLSAIVLVSSADDSAFWKDTPGHYVNIWLYQQDDDTVFLAEPGAPENNRKWIPLRYVYDALKTVSEYQYLAVTSYSEEENTWKWNGIDDIWNGKY